MLASLFSRSWACCPPGLKCVSLKSSSQARPLKTHPLLNRQTTPADPILAPSSVNSSKSDIEPSYDIEGVLTPQESVEGMLHVIPTKTLEHSGTFWTWEGRVSHEEVSLPLSPISPSFFSLWRIYRFNLCRHPCPPFLSLLTGQPALQ